MYAETELAYIYFQSFPNEAQHFDEFCRSNTSLEASSCLAKASTISDYNLGGEGDLFKAPEPVIEEQLMRVDPMTAAISMISCGENGIAPQSLSIEDIESSIENGQLLSEVFYECRKDLLAKEGNEMPLSEILSIKIPEVKPDHGNSPAECQILKSVSSSCLTSMEREHGAQSMFNFLGSSAVDFESIYGIRRSFSEGDIKSYRRIWIRTYEFISLRTEKCLDVCGLFDRTGPVIDSEFLWQTLGNPNMSVVQSPVELPMIISSYSSEERREKLSRYRSKKSKRNFGRKIKYACRKALADNQPRIRGRFAKTEELECLKKN